MAEEYDEETLRDMRRALEAEGISEAAQYGREEPEDTIEAMTHIINPSHHVEKVAPSATRETVLANLEHRALRPTVWLVNDLFEMAHFLRIVGIDMAADAYEERGFRLLNLSRSVGMQQQKELRTKRVEVMGEEKKKRWSWR